LSRWAAPDGAPMTASGSPEAPGLAVVRQLRGTDPRGAALCGDEVEGRHEPGFR
jgi:hypothetical protein